MLLREPKTECFSRLEDNGQNMLAWAQMPEYQFLSNLIWILLRPWKIRGSNFQDCAHWFNSKTDENDSKMYCYLELVFNFLL